jgi:hypothetical protein
VIVVGGEEFGSFATLRQAEYSISRNPNWIFEPTVEPVAVEPVAVEPVAVEPVAVEPVAVEPVAVEPVAVEPVAVEPVAVEPVAVEPVAVEPVAVEPVAVEPVAVEPVAVEPVAVEPVAVEPVAVEPVAVESDLETTCFYLDKHNYTAPEGWVCDIRFKSSRLLLGEIYFDTDNGYTLNGEKFYSDWKDLIDTFLEDYSPYSIIENERGSGRFEEFIYHINTSYKSIYGWVHELKFKSSRQTIGEMYLDGKKGYTLDGQTFYSDWTDLAEMLLADYYLLEEFR